MMMIRRFAFILFACALGLGQAHAADKLVTVTGEATVAVAPRTAGRLQDVFVRLGDRVTRGQRLRLRLDPLLDRALEDVDHLFLARMEMEWVRLPGKERRLDRDDPFQPVTRAGHLGEDTPVVLVAANAGGRPEGAHAAPPTGIALKRRMFSVIAVSVGSRSIDEAPKKPTTPSVFAST